MPEDRRYRDADWLREKYWEEELSTAEIGDICGACQQTISRWLRKHDIERRSFGNKRKDLIYKDEEWLHEQYVGERRSVKDIAEECDVCRDTIQKWMAKFDIEPRDYGGYAKDADYKDPEWLREKYHDEGMRLEEIADLAGVESEVTILRTMEKHGIDRRACHPGNEVTIGDRELAFLDGLLLGDGHLAPRKGGLSAQYEHSDSYAGFLTWLRDRLSELGLEQSGSLRELPNGSYALKTLAYRQLREQYDRWYPNGERKVPEDVELTPTTLLLWFLGDGRYNGQPSLLRDPMHRRSDQTVLVQEFERIGVGVDLTEKRYEIQEESESSFWDHVFSSPYSVPEVYEAKFPKRH